MRVIVPEPVTEADCELGEAPVWRADTATLGWVDVLAGRIHRARSDLTRLPAIALDRPVGAVAPAGAGWLAAAGSGFLRVDADGTSHELAQPEASDHTVRMNDGKCDPRGRFWAGSMGGGRRLAGSLYRLDPDDVLHRVLEGVGVSNGLGWSPDETRMYHVDSARGTLDVFNFDADNGAPTHRRTLVTVARPRTPDGLAVDDSGAIWLALWDGAAVVRHTPDGDVDTVVAMPVNRPTSCCFGDADGGTLYITTAAQGDQSPSAGAVFACRPGVTGRPATAYAGRWVGLP